MKKYTALLLTLFLVSCQPAFGRVENYFGSVQLCSDKAYKYALLVRYKDARIRPKEVIEVIAPRLNLPDGWEDNIEYVVDTIYEKDLTQDEVFSRVYIPCIYGYSQ